MRRSKLETKVEITIDVAACLWVIGTLILMLLK